MSANKATILENIPFTIDPERVLREMRISKITNLDELEEKPLADAIKKSIDKAYALIHGRGSYVKVRLTGLEVDEVKVEGLEGFFTGKNMVKLLGNCDFATLLAVTIGPDLENEVQRLSDAGDLTEMYALEMVGGWMADYMADRADERIDSEIKKQGYARTMRYSPGYGDWPLAKQSQLLKLVGSDRIGVTLTESSIMIPRKSVSAVIGWERQ